MPDNKQKCKNCKNRHLPPTGKKCRYVDNAESDAEPNGLRDAATASVSLDMDQADPGGQRIQEEILVQLKKMSHSIGRAVDFFHSTGPGAGFDLKFGIRKVK